jgi:hypothetical protein
MQKLLVNDWENWQTYRSDRGAPPWIKVHRNLLSNSKWATLSDAEKGQLVSIWIVAADNNGEVPNDARVLRKICQLDAEPDIVKFLKLGLLSCCDVNVASTWRQLDAPETETETETETDKSNPLTPQGGKALDFSDKKTNRKESIILPEQIDPETWNDYLEMRKKMKRPATGRAQELTIAKLMQFWSEGEEPNQILEQSIQNAWQGVFTTKGKNNDKNTNGSSSKNNRKRVTAAAAEAFAAVDRGEI